MPDDPKNLPGQDTLGHQLQSGDEAARREAARVLGQAATQRKGVAARENGKKGGRPKGGATSEESRARMREAQRRRRSQERAAREPSEGEEVAPASSAVAPSGTVARSGTETN
jgi:hypothetical protein